ncbi:MAG: hypothetical protein ACI3W6_04465 [Clostridia bacterium]
MTETDARRIAKNSAADTPRFGHFTAPSANQLLYFFSENLINGAIVTEMEERSLLRLSETIRKPLFLTVNTDREETLGRRERLPVSGLYFSRFPALQVIRNRKKPYISVFPENPEEDIAALFRINPPFALHCNTEKEAEQAARWIEKITKEMR